MFVNSVARRGCGRPRGRRNVTKMSGSKLVEELILLPSCWRSPDIEVGLAGRERKMRKERRTRMFRRLVVGLAVAAFVAPAAQARVDDLGAGRQADQSAPVIQGDDKVFAPGGGSAVLIHGDDKVIVGQPGDSTVLVHGDDKVFAPSQTADYTLAGYRRALPGLPQPGRGSRRRRQGHRRAARRLDRPRPRRRQGARAADRRLCAGGLLPAGAASGLRHPGRGPGRQPELPEHVRLA